MDKLNGKNLLIIGGSIRSVPLIKRAKERGLRVVVSSATPSAVGFNYADEKINTGASNTEALCALAITSNENLKIDGVMSVANSSAYSVAVVAKRLSLPGISVESADYTTDKLLMKGLFRDNGITVPRFTPITSFDHLERMLGEIDIPVVIKPVDSCDSRALTRLLPQGDARRAYEEAVKESPSGYSMMEEWISGRQLRCESLLTKDGLFTTAIYEKNFDSLDEFAPYVVQDGTDYPPNITEEQIKEIDIWLNKAVQALNISRGVFLGDFIIGPNGLLLVEVSPVLGSNLHINTCALSKRLELIDAAIDLALGLELSPDGLRPETTESLFISTRYLFAKQGLVGTVTIDDSLKNNKDKFIINTFVKEGDTIASTGAQPVRVASISAKGTSRETAREKADATLSLVHISTS